jgi:lipoprotein NlpD
MSNKINSKFILLLFLWLTACQNVTKFVYEAPVQDAETGQGQSGRYQVNNPGESIYSVAWKFKKDYLYLAQFNQLRHPYILHLKQILRIPLRAEAVVQGGGNRLLQKSKRRFIARKNTTIQQPKYSPLTGRGQWPVRGRVIQDYNPEKRQNGVDLESYTENIQSPFAGEIVYIGRGSPGYGQLVIIKHNRKLLSALGGPMIVLKSRGVKVKQGEILAHFQKGQRRIVHFEIRKFGHSVNPKWTIKNTLQSQASKSSKKKLYAHIQRQQLSKKHVRLQHGGHSLKQQLKARSALSTAVKKRLMHAGHGVTKIKAKLRQFHYQVRRVKHHTAGYHSLHKSIRG